MGCGGFSGKLFSQLQLEKQEAVSWSELLQVTQDCSEQKQKQQAIKLRRDAVCISIFKQVRKH